MGSTSSRLLESARARRAVRDTEHSGYAPAAPSAAALSALDGGVHACAAALAARTVTSEDLTLASILRCHGPGFALGAITHERYAAALDDARGSDSRRAAGRALGLLDGVPISVKDVFDIGGWDTTAGLAARAFRIAKEDGLVVKLVRSAGAVIVVKSNVPQALMVPETDNHMFGRCANPWAASRTAGGSSGGEGALVAARCVAAGLGTDIGGSIRIPAAFCGVVGFKPTPERITRLGTPAPRLGNVDGQHAVMPVAGPLTRSVADTVVLLEPLLARAASELDPTTPYLPFDAGAFSAAAGRPLRFARLSADGFWHVAPPCQRAVDDAAAALAAAGHSVVDFDCVARGLDLRKAAITYYALLAADGSLRGTKAGLEGEPLHALYGTLNTLASMPQFLKSVLAFVLRAAGMVRLADLLSEARARSTAELWDAVSWREGFKRDFIRELMQDNFDAVLAPAMGVPAFLHGQSRDLTSACAATFLFNLVGFPAGVVPVPGPVRADECTYAAPAGQRDKFAAEAARALVGAAGLPVGAQIAGLPFRDEIVLGAMAALEKALGGPLMGTPDLTLQATLNALRKS